MNLFVFNLLLALAWALLTGVFTAATFAEGFLLAYLGLLLLQPLFGGSSYSKKVWQVVSFAAFFIRELVVASLRVAVNVIAPRYRMRPGVVAIPLDVHTSAEITLLANLITLTPGTLTLDVSADRRVMYVHSMYIVDPDQFRQEIKQGFERRVQEVLR